MKLLLLLSIYGLFTANAIFANNVFKPDFGKQNQLYKVVTQNQGLSVDKHMKPLGPPPPPGDLTEVLENPTTSKIFFKPNFGKQEEIFKVLPYNRGLLVRNQVNSLGSLPSKSFMLSVAPKEMQYMEISNNKNVLENIPPEEFNDLYVGDMIMENFSNETMDEIGEYEDDNSDYYEYYY